MNRPLSEDEEKRLQYLFSEKVDAYLDAGHGACWMRRDKVASFVAGALQFFNGQRYHLHAWCVMPNLVHTVVQPLTGNELETILHSWKSYTAKEANKILHRTGTFWQDEYFDHLIRNESDYEHSIQYVLHNPDKAGLMNWKWQGSGTGLRTE